MTRVLTGITTSGTPHLGNYVGAIRPAIAASRAPGVESFYFLADLHSLVKVQDAGPRAAFHPGDRRHLAGGGLEPDKVWFYRQSRHSRDHRADLVADLRGRQGRAQPRARLQGLGGPQPRRGARTTMPGISAGLFMYPVLMAADILLFNAAQGAGGPRPGAAHRDGARLRPALQPSVRREYFTLPEAAIEENVATLPGLDGRKMSKSYDNTIPLFAPRDETEEADRLASSPIRGRRARPRKPKARTCSSCTRPSPAPRKPRRCARPSPKASAGATPSRSCSNASMRKWRRCASATRR